MTKVRLFTSILGCLFVSAIIAGCQPELDGGLKDALKDKFLIGVAMNSSQIVGKDTQAINLITCNFNSVVAENCMKSEIIQPVEGEFDFSQADQFVKFGEKHNMFIIGHTLIWHSQAPKWFFVDNNGVNVSPEILKQRMKTHIQTIIKRYKGRVKGWDVVNEAIEDNGSWRKSKFYEILGEDFVKYAFQFAYEADPDAELYYNDYSMALEGRRNAVVQMVKSLQNQGVKISAIGMQGHLGMDFPDINEFEKSIIAYSQLGVKVMITELDLSALPSPWTTMGANVNDVVEYQKKMNPYPENLPAEIQMAWEKRLLNFFSLFLKHSDKISRVTLWGLTDGSSWKNNFPIKGRTDYPLLFDRNYKPKPVVKMIIKMAEKTI